MALLNNVRNAGRVGDWSAVVERACTRPLRLAVYGHLNRHSGSSPGSHYMLIEYLLAQGHHIDLYAVGGFVEPQELHRFREVGVIAGHT